MVVAAAKSKHPHICNDKGVNDLLQRLHSGCRYVRFDNVDGGNSARLCNLAPPSETRAELRRDLTRACAGAPFSAPSGGTSPGAAPSGADVSAGGSLHCGWARWCWVRRTRRRYLWDFGVGRPAEAVAGVVR